MTRPDNMLRAIEKAYPYMWGIAEEYLKNREEMGGWPDWCFIPTNASHDIVTAEALSINLETAVHHQMVSALLPWSMTKGIYRFDPTLLEDIWQTPVSKELPIEVLFHLPEWCIYIDCSQRPLFGSTIHGFFAYLEYNIDKRRAELRLFIDLINKPVPVFLPLLRASLLECLIDASKEASKGSEGMSWYVEHDEDNTRETAVGIEPLISLLLYICSKNADIQGTSNKQPKRPNVKKLAAFNPPPQARKWDVGLRIGAALRRGRQQTGSDGPGDGSTRRTHVRRAHWHTYWVGPRDQQTPELKWLSPILVNAGDDDLPTVIRKVE